MQKLATAAVVALGLLAGAATTGYAQYYNYYGAPSTSSWSPYNYPGYQTSTSGNHGTIVIRGMGTRTTTRRFPAPKAYWDPYVAQRPYSDNAGPKASGHGSP